MREMPASQDHLTTGKSTAGRTTGNPAPTTGSSRWVETEPGIFHLDDEQRLPGPLTGLRVA